VQEAVLNPVMKVDEEGTALQECYQRLLCICGPQ